MAKTEWECVSCKQTVTLYITPLEPPSHSCKKKAGRIIQLTKKGNPQ